MSSTAASTKRSAAAGSETSQIIVPIPGSAFLRSPRAYRHRYRKPRPWRPRRCSALAMANPMPAAPAVTIALCRDQYSFSLMIAPVIHLSVPPLQEGERDQEACRSHLG